MCSLGNTIEIVDKYLELTHSRLSIPSWALQKTSLGGRLALTDLTSVLICLGATLYSFRLRNPEALEQLKLLTLNRAYGAIDVPVRGRHSRRNEPKHTRASEPDALRVQTHAVPPYRRAKSTFAGN